MIKTKDTVVKEQKDETAEITEDFKLDEQVSIADDELDEQAEEQECEVNEVNETPDAAFKRISSKRINQIGKYLGILENMAGQSYYSYSQEDLDKMFNYIDEAVASCKRAYRSKEEKTFSW